MPLSTKYNIKIYYKVFYNFPFLIVVFFIKYDYNKKRKIKDIIETIK